VLCRAQEQPALCVGDPGVGKTAIAEGFAKRMSRKRRSGKCCTTPPSRSTWARCWPARFRGDFEERLKQVVKELEDYPARSCSSTKSTP
jgi:ATP-dependent Clp protease ATP-binding subunit ClpA